MTFAATLLCLSCLAPSPQGDLRLPPRPKPAGIAAPVQRPLTEIEKFRRDLQDMQSSGPKVEAKLQEMSIDYPAIEPLVLEVARSARANEMQNLMVVARRFGTTEGSTRIADELLFQLLARPLAEATRTTVETMAFLKGQDARKALQECIRGRISAVRRHATDVYVTMIQPEDLPFALQLSSEQTLDLQLRGVDLLRAVPHDRARSRLVELLSKDPALAAAACDALVKLQQEAVPHLQRLLDEPPIDRGFAYAAFAMAQIENATGRPLLAEKLVPALLPRLRDREALTRCLVAVPLADIAYRSDPAGGTTFPDAELAEALLEVVAPAQFVPNLDMLRQPAEQRLLRLTGRVVAGGEGLAWRDWWKDQAAGFVGLRSHVVVDDKNAANAVVTLRQDKQFVRLLAEGLADVPPVPGALEVLLTGPQMRELTLALEAGGFRDAELMRVASGLPLVRSLQVQVLGARAQVAMPMGEHPAFDALVHVVQQRLDGELWQLYRHPTDEPDRAAFWRAERRWLDANPDPIEQGRRFARRAVQNWPVLSQGLRARAIEHLFARGDRRKLLGEAEGDRILALLRQAPELTAVEQSLLELAAGVPGDRVWRECVDYAARAVGGGRDAVRAVFAVLGPDAVLAALQDERPVVRRVAVDEIVRARDQRAGARLVELLADADEEVRRTAAYACGQLQVAASSRPLVAAIVAEDTPPALRRECLKALGRVGGDQAFAVLERSLSAPAQEDKEAALRGLGELADPRAAHLLAELAVMGHGKDLGALARFYLQRQGGTRAVPALRHQVQIVQDPAIRAQLVLLLGLYQDPQAVPDLMDLLRVPQQAGDAAGLLAGTTGVDLVDQSDRIGTIEQWWRKNRAAPQWQWLLDGLKAAAEPTVLRAEHFSPGAGTMPVPELARLLVDSKTPRLCVLASAVLRSVTGEDFGIVTMQTPLDVREGIAARYRMLAESARAAQGR